MGETLPAGGPASPAIENNHTSDDDVQEIERTPEANTSNAVKQAKAAKAAKAKFEAKWGVGKKSDKAILRTY